MDDTLIAIRFSGSGFYTVIELPARSTEKQVQRKQFGTVERAEAFVEDQYPPEVVMVTENDITEEIERRKAIFSRSVVE